MKILEVKEGSQLIYCTLLCILSPIVSKIHESFSHKGVLFFSKQKNYKLQPVVILKITSFTIRNISLVHRLPFVSMVLYSVPVGSYLRIPVSCIFLTTSRDTTLPMYYTTVPTVVLLFE